MNQTTFKIVNFLGIMMIVLLAPEAHALGIGIEPVVGFQILKNSNPTRTTKTLTYGARLVAGIEILSAEAEYSRGTSNETFPAYDLQIKQTTERYRLGLRSDLPTSPLSFFRFRAGAEARKVKEESTSGGILTTTTTPSYVYPYVGAGVGVGLTPKFKVVAEVTVTILDSKNFSRNEISPSIGLAIGI